LTLLLGPLEIIFGEKYTFSITLVCIGHHIRHLLIKHVNMKGDNHTLASALTVLFSGLTALASVQTALASVQTALASVQTVLAFGLTFKPLA